MKSEAIRCAIKLHAEPELLARFSDPFRKLPRGITELLRIVASDAVLKKISSMNRLNASRFKKILLHYIQTVLLQKNNSDYRKLGLSSDANQKQCKLHYKLLMNIFHPDKISSEVNPHYHTQVISRAYRNIKKIPSSPPPALTQFSSPNLSSMENNNFRLKRNNKRFKLKSNQFEAREYLMHSVVGLFVIVIFTVAIFLVSPSSPQLIVKKQTSTNTLPINKSSEAIDKIDKMGQDLLSSIK